MINTVQILPAATPEQIDTARSLFVEYQQWLKFSLCFQGFDKELIDLPGAYAPPKGRLYIAESNGKVAGCIALRPMEETGFCEMKRLFVREEFRGRRIGRMLTETILMDAREIGFQTMRLDTLERMESARTLYSKLGFRVIPAYYGNPLEEAVYMEVKL